MFRRLRARWRRWMDRLDVQAYAEPDDLPAQSRLDPQWPLPDEPCSRFRRI